MRVSLIAPDLERETIRSHLLVQARFFNERGDKVCLALSTAIVVQFSPSPRPSPPGEREFCSPPLGEELGEGENGASLQLQSCTIVELNSPVSTAPAGLPDDLSGLAMVDCESLPPSDLYIYHLESQYPLLQALKRQDQGIVLIHDHSTTSDKAPEQDSWLPAHFADLCLVDHASQRDELVSLYGLPPERICLLPPPDRKDAYHNTLAKLVDDAMTGIWPPAPQVEPPVALPEAALKAAQGRSSAKGMLRLAQSQADVMQRDYAVRSRIPLLGGLVAWARRNLTSHLREPYLDPALERQVAFNRTVVTWMEQVQAQVDALETEIQRLKEQPRRADEADRQVGHDG